MADPVRILIADDHTLFRQGLRRVLELEPGFTVVGEASTAAEAVSLCLELDPDVVTLDISMPGGGLQVISRLRSRARHLGIVILTMHEDQEYLLRAIRAGAHAYLVKDADSQSLITAIRHAATGRSYMHPTLAGEVLRELALGREPSPMGRTLLTEREREVLRLVSQGATNREIAQALWLSQKTIKNHLTHIFEKLGVSDRTQAALWAIRSGLVPDPGQRRGGDGIGGSPGGDTGGAAANP
ncbi:response regulator [Caldinitratiruptor microaerophilus]|uniref:Stage 0 sporulation protein A homolog n=1 Tax=Caldinitratiruptor microaerophilus TaxID=671077 RepID=A0AA35CMF2_9FIRM|nr:response regulator transcription factor [Caldinitratiruptor microaerophilus]BDG60252.1 DNA-binding response regulator [Caldinitratiruptor microaerophilus]